MLIQVKRLEPDHFNRPRLRNVKTGMIYADINLGNPRFGPPSWHTTTKSIGEPIAPIREDIVFEVIEEVKGGKA